MNRAYEKKNTALIKVLSLRKILTNAFQDAKAVITDVKMSSFVISINCIVNSEKWTP